MAYTSKDASAIARTSLVESALSAVALQGAAIAAARDGALGNQGGEGLPDGTVSYGIDGAPILPPQYWRVGTVPGILPIRPGGGA